MLRLPPSGVFDTGATTASAATVNAGPWITPAAAAAPVKFARSRK